MAETDDLSKAVIKGARRASFARAFHVTTIGRKKPYRTLSPTQENAEITSAHLFSTRPATPSTDAREAGNRGNEGAEIPDIPLRRSSNTKTLGADDSGSRLATLEQILAKGESQKSPDDHHLGPINPNPAASRSNKRTGAQLTAFWEPPLLPQAKHLRDRSLPDVPEASPASTIKHATGPSSEPLEHPVLPPWRESRSAPESTAGSVLSSRGAHSPSTLPARSRDRVTFDSSIASTSLLPDMASPLPGLQTKGADEACDALDPVAEEDVEPGSFDLVVPATNLGVYSLERRSELLFSVAHLRVIFDDPIFLHRFTNFVGIYRPRSVPLLRYYLDALKAIRAMEWINGIISGSLRLEGHDFVLNGPPRLTENESLRQIAEAAFEALARDDLPAYVTHVWTEIVEMSMRRRITGTLPAHLQNMSDGLAEVFCITDPSRTDNPIVFSSEEFHRTTQYGLDYVIGRNCRFLQGPKTNPFAVTRIRERLEQGKEHYETFLNYRRDGSPFMNLLMCAPLMDSMGTVRYFLGAQIDVSGLAKGCSGLESLRRLVDQDEEDQKRRAQGSHTDGQARFNTGIGGGVGTAITASTRELSSGEKEEDEMFRLLAETLNTQELETTRRFGGRMHRSQQEQVQHLESMSNWHKRRVVIHDSESSPPPTPPPRRGNSSRAGSRADPPTTTTTGNLQPVASPRTPTPTAAAAAPTLPTAPRGPRVPTIYENYLVVRPHPSLRILFASPPLRVPGILQSHLMSRIGGSRRIHEELGQAFAMGQGVTAKVKWIPGGGAATRAGDNRDSSSNTNTLGGTEGRPRWIHCTPLTGSNGSVGVWVVVIVDEDATTNTADLDGGRRHHGRDRDRERDREVLYPADGRGARRIGGGRGRDTDSALWDSMSINDFAAMNSLPEDEELRQHVRDL
ncbi:hypothetical protein VPNG_02290 [Cytospora leucostoma]|uniref:PAC domain-containing protein n=1 Tax=Cytospora leucostoma TaxID=1230097 RepID=A0A423XGV3_9PEZI|nr:hypothetical protein VPNG_02290 [Cytospora leucostoma]